MMMIDHSFPCQLPLLPTPLSGSIYPHDPAMPKMPFPCHVIPERDNEKAEAAFYPLFPPCHPALNLTQFPNPAGTDVDQMVWIPSHFELGSMIPP